MQRLQRHSRSLWAAPLSHLRALGAQLKTFDAPLRLGIASRLSVAFIGVAALALAANFIVEQGVMIERTTEITRTAPPPAPVMVFKAPAEPEAAAQHPAEPSVRRSVSSEPLLAAIARFGGAVRARTHDASDRSEAERQRSGAALELAGRDFAAQAAALSGRTPARVLAALNAYQAHGNEIVRIADEGRAAMNEHAALIEALNSRVNRTLSDGWKIFGRVMARQSLVQLSTDLDALRQSSAAIKQVDSADSPAVSAVIASESAVTNTLETNEKGLRRSQGDQWYAAMHAQIADAVKLRKSLLQSNAQLDFEAADFAQEEERLGRLIPRRIEAPPPAAPAPAAPAPAAPAPAPLSEALEPGEAAPSIVAPDSVALPLVETHSFTKRTPQDNQRRALIAWTSVAVMLLLIIISLGTVLSIVRPVRRLLSATARIAKGDSSVRVPRGGIRELDTLAVAFNAMADELSIAKAAARDYQHGLEAKVAERTQQLQDLAEHDPLTGLPNRRELFSLLNAALQRARSGGYLIGILFLDVDNFKYINDSLGHAFGDRVLVSLAERLKEATAGLGFPARLGGDEFTVVLERPPSVADIRAAGLAVVQAFQRPLSVDGRELIVSVSVGASIYPEHEQYAEALLKAADAALFRAKALGRSQLSVYTPELLEAAAAKFSTEQRLRRAIERGEFELLFQPEVCAETLEIGLVEALIRWRMPDGGLATPSQFLAIAEESGLIMEISEWVLHSAIEAAAEWHHGAWPEARVAINVSPRQLFDHRFVDRLQRLLDQYRLPARCIEIELTESVLQTGAATFEALKRLRERGVAIALDDFGTGYSSLASLEQLPLSRIKLDYSLIEGIDRKPRSAAIARAIIDLCASLGLEVTAEGVERPEQFALLMGYRAMFLQGYLLSQPLPREALVAEMANVAQRAKDLLLCLPPAAAAPRAKGARRTRGEVV